MSQHMNDVLLLKSKKSKNYFMQLALRCTLNLNLKRLLKNKNKKILKTVSEQNSEKNCNQESLNTILV